jgi:hypothetical protein
LPERGWFRRSCRLRKLMLITMQDGDPYFRDESARWWKKRKPPNLNFLEALLDTPLMIKFDSDLRQVSGFSPSTLVSSINRTDCHDIAEILLKVVLNTITLTPHPHKLVDRKKKNLSFCWVIYEELWIKYVYILPISHPLYYIENPCLASGSPRNQCDNKIK